MSIFQSSLGVSNDHFIQKTIPIIQQFAYHTVKWYFLNNGYSTYDCDILLSEQEIIYPVSWRNETLLAISKNGFKYKQIRIPSIWKHQGKVLMNHITTDGLKPIGELEGKEGKITLNSEPDIPLVITTP